jgi:hypothetical protein
MGEVVVWDLMAESDGRKNSTFDELIAQLQAENRLLEELLGRDTTDSALGGRSSSTRRARLNGCHTSVDGIGRPAQLWSEVGVPEHPGSDVATRENEQVRESHAG